MHYTISLIIFSYFCDWMPAAVFGQKYERSRSVWVEQGLIRGKVYKIDGRLVQIFRGVPYGEPPLGQLRFKRSEMRRRWEREYSALEYGPPCIQFMDFHKNDRYSAKNMERESEDCLYLNIFSPYDSEDESHLFPIMVWIHGGSFLAGSADTGIDMETVTKNIVRRNITFVSINYRLGPLGFMTVNYGDRVDGNFGIWDQRLALEWIQRNIKQFNGDPTRVTVVGESSGAAAVTALALSPLTKGLLSGAIAMSGSATSGWAVHRHQGAALWDMHNIAEYIRCNKIIPEEDLAEVLSRGPPSDKQQPREFCNLQEFMPDCLINGGNLGVEQMLDCFRNEVNFSTPLFWLTLSHELGVSKMVTDGELIVDLSEDSVREAARVPLMTGVARREWAHKKPEFYDFYRYKRLNRQEVEESVRKIIETAYITRLSSRVSNTTLSLITNATMLRYMSGVDFNFDMPEVITRLQDLEADIDFVSPCQSEVDGYVASGNNVFVYSFDYVPRSALIEEDQRYYSIFGDNSITVSRKEKAVIGYIPSAFHGLDHAFLFTQGYTSNFFLEEFTKRDKVFSRILTKMIANFVHHGNPSTENFTWPAYTNDTRHYASIDLPPRMILGPLHFPVSTFWNDEVRMLSKYTLAESISMDQAANALSQEERIQLDAYRRSWYAMWAFVVGVAILIWLALIFVAWQKIRSPMKKPYENIVVNNYGQK